VHGDTLTVVFVRHAEAEHIGNRGLSDRDRPLTPKGREDATAVGRALAKLDHTRPSMILTSPLVRAVETGKHLAQAYGPDVRCTVSILLSPGIDERALLDELLRRGREGMQMVILVGHQPDIGNFISYLIAANMPASLALPPGTAARISLRATGGRPEGLLDWLMPPAAARSLVPPSLPPANL